jgi:hypothetical protein
MSSEYKIRKCLKINDKEICYDLYPNTNALSIGDVYPEWYKLEEKELGIRNVSVKKIVGATSTRKTEYDKNFMPKNPDTRWLIVLESVLKNGYKLNKRSPPVLLKMGGRYFVSSDGNRRVSVAKLLEIRKIKAEVIEIYF